MSPLQQQRPLVGDGLRLTVLPHRGDKFFSIPRLKHIKNDVIPAGTKWRAGTSGDFAAQDPRLADAIGDDSACGSFSLWTHLGGNLVPPKWMIKDGRDIWVVKCAALQRR
ncbi:MAG: hypothetical protein CFE27_14560 [Alphaproteobacteria bacterium PA1]|nr:MAG: hypothetical protein CFE27_14560 [Alphaproteobacteria bacterium PA1]